MRLNGIIRDKNGNTLNHTMVEIKNSEFQTLYSSESDNNGYFAIDVPSGRYPFVTAVKEYGVNYLEYWCHNIDLSTDKMLDITIGCLELYGLNVFVIDGAYNSLMVYFRPMSLKKFQKKETNICPDIKSIQVSVDGQETVILSENEIDEYIGDMTLKAYLLQVSNPNMDRSWKEVSVFVSDENGDCGAATIYH